MSQARVVAAIRPKVPEEVPSSRSAPSRTRELERHAVPSPRPGSVAPGPGEHPPRTPRLASRRRPDLRARLCPFGLVRGARGGLGSGLGTRFRRGFLLLHSVLALIALLF